MARDDPRLRTGKYEPLVHINAMLMEEVQRVMATGSGGNISLLGTTVPFHLFLFFFLIFQPALHNRFPPLCSQAHSVNVYAVS